VEWVYGEDGGCGVDVLVLDEVGGGDPGVRVL
jgi:hypothetical protein